MGQDSNRAGAEEAGPQDGATIKMGTDFKRITEQQSQGLRQRAVKQPGRRNKYDVTQRMSTPCKVFVIIHPAQEHISLNLPELIHLVQQERFEDLLYIF